jgi:hypothetical protein
MLRWWASTWCTAGIVVWESADAAVRERPAGICANYPSDEVTTCNGVERRPPWNGETGPKASTVRNDGRRCDPWRTPGDIRR